MKHFHYVKDSASRTLSHSTSSAEIHPVLSSLSPTPVSSERYVWLIPASRGIGNNLDHCHHLNMATTRDKVLYPVQRNLIRNIYFFSI